MKNKFISEEDIQTKFGVDASKVIDVQSLAGDSIDNVPGVPGIGVKTAALLINEYGDLETLLDRAEEIKQPKRRQNLIGICFRSSLTSVCASGTSPKSKLSFTGCGFLWVRGM